ncbi:MAG: glycosyltransferase family 2 protein [Marinosulfonomonas sp.]
MKITAVTCVKNEGPFLLEWIAFHRILGVTDFLFYSNDCDDGTDDLLDALQSQGIVQHLPNPATGRHYQMEALKDAVHHQVIQNADWVWVADVDEFLNIHVGDGTIPDLIQACGTPMAISVTFQFFSNDDVIDFTDEPVIGQFLHSHNPDIWGDQLAIEVKTLTRKDFPLQYYGAHRPFFRKLLPRDHHPSWTDGSGRPVPAQFLTAALKQSIRRFPAAGARNFATLNHYALRSMDSYLVKNARGDVNRENRKFEDIYWRERNDNAYFDDSILKYLPRLKAEMTRLRALPKIAQLHQASVQRHREKLTVLKQDKAIQKLIKRLKSASKIPPAEQELMEQLLGSLSR